MKNQQIMLALFIVLGAGLIAIPVTALITIQEAEAQGCINPNAPGGGSLAFNASQGRCAVSGGPP